MRTQWLRFILMACTILALTLAGLAEEQQLAGIRIGMSKDDVVNQLGLPSGKIIALPPTMIKSDNSTGVAAPGNPSSMTLPNVLLFSDYLSPDAPEVTIGVSTIVISGSVSTPPVGQKPKDPKIPAAPAIPTSPFTPPIGGPLGSITSPGIGGGDAADVVKLPAWAYTVRATTLRLDQEQLIYKLNDTYAIGITLANSGGATQVTDVVISSVAPLRTPTIPYELRTKSVNWYYGAKKKYVPAQTSQGVTLGSRFSDVLKLCGWTEYLFAFESKSETTIENGKSDDIGVTAYSYSGQGTSLTVSPSPDLWRSETPAGKNSVLFTDGDALPLKTGFSNNYLLIYPTAKVTFTLIDNTVIRIHIGSGVITPPPTPEPPSAPVSDGTPPSYGGNPPNGGDTPPPVDTLF